MIYRPQQIQKMWDTWMYYQAGTYFLYYLVTERSPGEGICLATSSDGVHWDEHGLFFPKAENSQWLGTGSVWQSSAFEQDSQYIMNFSEWRGPSMREGQQTIFFAVSTDLVHWNRLGPEYEFVPDPRWYRINEGNSSRWDCIYTIPRPGGGRYGYWTANPKDFHPGIGFGESSDGLHWEAFPPPFIEWGNTPKMVNMEAGAVERIGERYYAMFGSYSPYLEHSNGMFLFVANAPEGPFQPAATNYRLLTSPAEHKMTYFARFFPTDKGVLVNHHAMTRSDERYFAPLKRAVVDVQGTMRLHYWEGNDALKGDVIPVEFRTHDQEMGSTDRAVMFFDQIFDLAEGIVVEGTILISPVDADGARKGTGFYLEQNAEQGTMIHVLPDGVVEYGTITRNGLNFRQEERIERGGRVSQKSSFRLLLRHSLSEFYLNDILIQCYSLPQELTGQIGLMSDAGKATVEGLAIFRMALT